MQLSKQSMMTVYLIEILCLAPGLDANGFTWFDAQEKCRSVDSTITDSNSNTSEKYWTTYYYRESQWIGEYGCYFKNNFTESKNKRLHLSSAGLCQEFCLENHGSNDMFFFAVKDESCVCLKNCPVGSSVSRCSFPCLENQNSSKFSSCGGGSAYSVFLSQKVTPSEILNTHDRNVCQHRNPVDNTGSLICNDRSGKCSIKLTRQVYVSYDRNQNLTDIWKKSIIKCQRCKHTGDNPGCPYVDCYEKVVLVYCSNGKIFKAQIQSRTNKSTSSVFTTLSINTTKLHEGLSKTLTTKQQIIKASSQKYHVDSTSHYDKISSTVAEKNGNTGKNTLSTSSGSTILSISTKKFPEGHSKTLTTKKVFIKGSSQKYPLDSTSQYDTISSTVAEENEMKENGNKDDLPFQVGILISTIGISIIFLGVFASCVRKRYLFPNHTGFTLPKPTSTSHDTGREERSLETNCNAKQIRPSTENYSCNYSLAGNINIELGNFSEEEQYHHLWEHANECNADDNYYMKAEHHASKKDNISFDGGENHYNCLRETMPLRYEEEDTYSHAQNVDLSNSSNYGVMNVKRKSEKIIGDDLYDHFETNQ